MKYLLDTNIVSELRKRDRGDPNAIAWWGTVAGTDLYLSVLAVGELRKGVERARLRDVTQAYALSQWIDGLYTTFSDRIVGIWSFGIICAEAVDCVAPVRS